MSGWASRATALSFSRYSWPLRIGPRFLWPSNWGTDRHPRQYRLQANIEQALFDQLSQRIAQALVA